MLAVQDNVYSRFLAELCGGMKRPRAVVLFSAHWVSRTQRVTATDRHTMIYDFGGFPDELYQIQYPAAGDDEVTEWIGDLFDEHSIAYLPERQRGLDHGAWVVLRRIFKDADIPVVALSVNPLATPEQQYAIGRALCDLRRRDVLIIGSGGTVHNLRAISFAEPERVDEWALSFDQWLETQANQWHTDALFAYASLAPAASMAVVPGGNEHFVPFFYAMGAADDVRTATLLHRSYQYGNLSHSVWQFG